jgi:hypothetical protein
MNLEDFGNWASQNAGGLISAGVGGLLIATGVGAAPGAALLANGLTSVAANTFAGPPVASAAPQLTPPPAAMQYAIPQQQAAMQYQQYSQPYAAGQYSQQAYYGAQYPGYGYNQQAGAYSPNYYAGYRPGYK